MADKSSAVFSKGTIFYNSLLIVAMKRDKRQLVLNKGAQKFIFRYDGGCEDQLLEVLIEQAKDKLTDFDWFDAAVLSFKLTQSLINQADELLRKPDTSDLQNDGTNPGTQFCMNVN